MICVTGAERDVASLCARIASTDDLLCEVRADQLERIDDALFDLVAREGPRILFCCRPPAQGGAFAGSEAERVGLLERAERAGARWIDVEHDVPLERFDRSRVVLSWHDFDGADELLRMARELAPRRAGVLKLAVRVDDAAQIERLREARAIIDGPAVLIAMGAAGLLSRVRYGSLGSEWTYVAADHANATAPGQLDLDEARAMGLPGTRDAPFCALVGGPQVFSSPGPRVYNACYRRRGLALSYLPIITTSLRATLPLFEKLGARGLSVTMPLKGEALALSTPDSLAAAVQSVNSLRPIPGGWEGTNTDIEGVRAPLAQVSPTGTALILGAGGAARAAAHACRGLGLGVVVSARTARGPEEVIPWEDRAHVVHDVLINATPIAGDTSPWPDDAPLAKCVFDLAIAERSLLLERASREGGAAIDARRMWIHQGARQMSWMLDTAFTAQELEAELS